MSRISKLHEQAKQKSIIENRCVKVHSGMYYYKGYFISQDGGYEFPWNYGKDMLIDYSSAKTKKECMYYIDCMENIKTL